MPVEPLIDTLDYYFQLWDETKIGCSIITLAYTLYMHLPLHLCLQHPHTITTDITITATLSTAHSTELRTMAVCTDLHPDPLVSLTD